MASFWNVDDAVDALRNMGWKVVFLDVGKHGESAWQLIPPHARGEDEYAHPDSRMVTGTEIVPYANYQLKKKLRYQGQV